MINLFKIEYETNEAIDRVLNTNLLKVEINRNSASLVFAGAVIYKCVINNDTQGYFISNLNDICTGYTCRELLLLKEATDLMIKIKSNENEIQDILIEGINKWNAIAMKY